MKVEKESSNIILESINIIKQDKFRSTCELKDIYNVLSDGDILRNYRAKFLKSSN